MSSLCFGPPARVIHENVAVRAAHISEFNILRIMACYIRAYLLFVKTDGHYITDGVPVQAI